MSQQQTQEYLLNRIIDKITEYYIADNAVSLEEALYRIYNSKIYSMLKNEDCILLSQSPSYIYSMMSKESL